MTHENQANIIFEQILGGGEIEYSDDFVFIDAACLFLPYIFASDSIFFRDSTNYNAQ